MTLARFGIAALLLTGLLSASCRKTAPTAARPRDANTTSYVGIAFLGGSPMNLLILTQEAADSSHSLSGYITYQSQTIEFSEITVNATADTLTFGYVRSGANYHAWALVRPLDLEVHYTEPEGIALFHLNREVNGYNMTGIWTGDMSSTLLQGQRSVTLTMEQSGSAFSGAASVNFVEPWTFLITSGTVAGNAFQISGTAQGSGIYPTTWNGNYVGFDNIRGVWSAGGESEVDGGEFAFTRYFQ